MNQPHAGEGTVYQYPGNHQQGQTYVGMDPTSPFAGVARPGGRSSRPAFGTIYQTDKELTDEKGNLRTEIMRVNHSHRKRTSLVEESTETFVSPTRSNITSRSKKEAPTKTTTLS